MRKAIEKFRRSELIMLTLYQEEDRKTTIETIQKMMEDLYYDETELKDLAQRVIAKLEIISDAEFEFLKEEVLPGV